MSAPASKTGPAGGTASRRAVLSGAAAVLVLALAGGAMWLLGDDGTRGGGEATVVAPSAKVSGTAFVDRDAGSSDRASASTLPETAAPDVARLDVSPVAAPSPGDEVHGVAMRASDGSPVRQVTVIALHHDEGGDVDTEMDRARTDSRGAFTLRVRRPVSTFVVPTVEPDKTSESFQPGRTVPLTAHWVNDDAASNAVRLVLDTGWRLDVRVIDGSGGPRAGVLVKGGSRSATTDNDGRCALLDLPAGEPSLTLTLRPVPGATAITKLVDGPEAGSLRKDVTLTLP